MNYPFYFSFFYIDKISFLMVVLTLLVYFILNNLTNKTKLLSFCCKFCCFVCLIFFVVSDFFLLLICFESSLIFIYLVILGWGYTKERLQAGYYLMMYTVFYCFPLMFFIVGLSMQYDLFLHKMNYIYLSFEACLMMIGPFLVKCPIYFLHLWLPKAHVEAPVVGSILLAGILLKLGTYGLFRVMNMFLLSFNFLLFIIIIVLVGMVLSSVVCFIQSDQKSMIAYMSVNHMGLLVCVLLTLNDFSVISSMSMMLLHGLISSMLFYCSYIMFYSTYSRMILINQGFLFLNSFLMFMFIGFMMMNLSIPIFPTFFVEWLMYSSLYGYSILSMFYMVICLLIFGYLCFYLMSNSFHGKPINFFWMSKMQDFFIIFGFCLYMPWCL